MAIRLFQVDGRAFRLLDVREGRWVARLGSDTKDDALYQTPKEGDHLLILGSRECEAVSYVMVSDEDGEHLATESDCIWTDDKHLALKAYYALAKTHVAGHRIEKRLSLFTKDPWQHVTSDS